ncbi:MAG: hypothetical protein IJD71_00025, partial [Clostridia bacterium]|nr:hypothetical protein [Clostridia bacterium]
MKNKIYKVLSLLLTFLIIFSACACVLGTVSAAPKDAIYFVRASSNDINNDGSAMSKSLKT